MYRVNEATCTGCGDCVAACPPGAIALAAGRATIDEARCADCGSCADACPQGAIVIADAAISSGASMSAVVPAVPAAASVEAISLARRPEIEVLPATSRRSRLWPAVGGALVWAARELLPEVIAAWRTPRAVELQPTSRNSTTFGLAAFTHRRTGHRHRWGRA